MLDNNPNEAATGPASVDTGSDTTPVTATVNPAPALATAETGFGDLDGTPAPIRQAATTANTVADTGERANPDADLDARVAALLPNKSITNWNDVSAFMGAVVPWPGSTNAGYVNMHFSFPSRDDPKVLVKKGGWPKKTITDFIGSVTFALKCPTRYKDIWYCTSLQSGTKTNINGKLRAHRLKANALKLKSIWIDVDVGPDEIDPKTNKITKRHYHSEEEALKAILVFLMKVGLPLPSAIVRSGGGLHVYWISKDELTPAEWLPYADGLKQLLLANNVHCDASITTDSARILRVPGTFNYKPEYGTPREVRLVPLPLKLYDFPAMLAFLQQFARPTIAATPKPGFDKHSDMLLDPRPIFTKCGFYREALRDGGASQDQPQWNLAILGTTFMENGNEIAHKVSSGHKDYSKDDTQALYDRKVAERKAGSIGYPNCVTIQGSGCAACAACPHLSKGKSPLHLGLGRARAPDPTQATTAVATFRDLDRQGQPKPTLANAVIAIRALGIEVRLDLFHNRTMVSYRGTSKTIRDGSLTDHNVSAVRSLINNTFLIDCGDPTTLAALHEIARDNAFDPVLDLLNECQGKWDGVKRLDTWTVNYLGCEDTPLTRAIGRSVLVAACRRARVPGCKFDFITVLEGPEGIEKSTAIRILAGDDNFNDQSILGASDKEVQEQLEGTWMHENADLAGMRRAEVEQVKAFASRQIDRARPAYGRVREDRPRRSIEWATTNNDTYLLSQTGNRRWWTLKTGKVNIQALKRDREQLLGEAATYEAAGQHIGLDESLWDDARRAQEQRRVSDPWEDALANLKGQPVVHRSGDGYERVFSGDLLTHVLQIPKAQQTSQHSQRLANAMKHLGWGRSDHGRITIGGVTLRGYIRAVPFNVAQELAHTAMGITDPPPPPIHTGICD